MDHHVIRAGTVAARVKAEGAEVTSLTCGADGELLWQAGPQWPRHAPVLFPTVGRLTDDTLVHDGRSYRMTQHGFARDSLFSWIERGEWRAVLELTESEATLAAYPFRFRLRLIYEVSETGLSVTTRVVNTGDVVLPCGVGAHPAFIWPLREGVSKESHSLLFEAAEPGPAWSVRDGLLGGPVPAPMTGRELPLSPDLFVNDALVLLGTVSRSVRYRAHDAAGEVVRSLTVAWSGYRDLGIWSKPGGAPFLCIEPWYGSASPHGWQGEFMQKPGIMLLAPGEERDCVWSVSL